MTCLLSCDKQQLRHQERRTARVVAALTEEQTRRPPSSWGTPAARWRRTGGTRPTASPAAPGSGSKPGRRPLRKRTSGCWSRNTCGASSAQQVLRAGGGRCKEREGPAHLCRRCTRTVCWRCTRCTAPPAPSDSKQQRRTSAHTCTRMCAPVKVKIRGEQLAER